MCMRGGHLDCIHCAIELAQQAPPHPVELEEAYDIVASKNPRVHAMDEPEETTYYNTLGGYNYIRALIT